MDAGQRTVLDRDGLDHPLLRLAVADRTLYYARAVDYPGFSEHERWLIPDFGWSVSRFRWRDGWHEDFHWYIETELMEVAGPIWSLRDGFIDVLVWEGLRARIDDADELGDALVEGSISIADASDVLHSLDRLCDELHANGNSGAALLERYAPGLPK